MSNSFAFPSIHDFPPFYTFQPTQTTWQNQVALWSEIILSYYRHHKLYRLELSEALNSELFYNKGINRMAEWDSPPKKTTAIIYWRKPEEWATLINNWVFEAGMTNSILTVYEIAHGDTTEGLEFHKLDQIILMKSLDILVKKGVAQTFQGTSADDI
ncbi:13687_t:CDS:2, partial [Funneliformis mosseae]